MKDTDKNYRSESNKVVKTNGIVKVQGRDNFGLKKKSEVNKKDKSTDQVSKVKKIQGPKSQNQKEIQQNRKSIL
ncbi:hypothetical protein AYI70_g6607 [Smittium culicis]|uniref:Uncharacterized protein n=1 Tax=Smittium culicis TaxID=133412 RepID=A0A1R1XP61_9FUNG|nr:hypothetical protein AYI70_g6607 [Smittium culicis]